MILKQLKTRNEKIKELYAQGNKRKKLTEKFSLSYSSICQIVRREEKTPLCIVCARCQKKFTTYNTKQIFCSRCSTALSGRDRTRMLVRIRDNFTCQACGRTRTKKQARGRRLFDIHHLNGLCGKLSRGYDKVAFLTNLITLCHKCHFNHSDHSQKALKVLTKNYHKNILLICRELSSRGDPQNFKSRE